MKATKHEADATAQAKRRAETEKQKAVNGLLQRLANFNKLATTQSYDQLLKQQLEILELQKEFLIQAPDGDIPPETKEVQKRNIDQYIGVFKETQKNIETN